MMRYSKFCIKGRLTKFIEKFHSNDRYILWADNASCHYGSETVNVLENSTINYVPKSHNPANVPQLRPIERFWAMLKQKVYANGYQAENLHSLRRRIVSKIKTFDLVTLENLFHNFESNIRIAASIGPDEVL
ncbi:uncharacterized protein B4U80_11465 [Leptotrombidium deliense]|uniref:Tc1-like transposase DDE domain-containing protein n=1 Tax=Leptotrombidium deliense TaxID=299467 RepID=A0A443RXJ7_9ACAR|nr:uncharacterized protein B4U80_11465 [Leptotrombidium deliense]